ncbi:phosphoethanolamine transferase CptA [Pseudomonas mandelii]|jgi:heptose-I-phosphate ethanolaminephosphotransferase|uniref:Phosphoethanolamine transferase CptA n=2 Tax=Pseudomonas fluorescens group TaxID=136843 RepID=A0AB36CZ56_9PSED|nr:MULTISPECIES: phosphoethanolamine transferase CptA [Pseudomonas]MDF9880884.1 heptose-I-phosphate ethanolaminephosphotransferase [Pseudomonas silensiensis]MBA4359823.1 phosphoethanolamine transferase CptA [Pseudomonas sp.]MDI1332739.1 phosphoethanolamine transferase CptA [Pseudomonas sp.]MSU98181.1 phosphoethanolamine transferase CptA [Pseudomonas mandelii]NMZ81462.1 phosphoethanolamine transferase CptA [Pseudomonas mandelii]
MTVFKRSNTTAKGFDWAGFLWLFLFFWYFSGITQLLIQLTGTSGFTGFRQAFVMSAIWLAPMLLFPRQTRVMAAVIGVVLWACSMASLGYFFIYQQEFSQSVIFIMFESNISEAGEYMTQYFAWWMVAAFLAHTLFAYFLWTRLRPVYMPRGRALVAATAILVAVVGYPLIKQTARTGSLAGGFEKFETRIEPAVPWQMAVAYHRYLDTLAGMQDMLDSASKIPPLKNLKDTMANQPATLVLVIGESTNRQRMSLYGYPRETTPELDKLKDQMAVFDNVITPRPYTIEALQQVLTFADEENPDLYLSTPSLVSMMKQAGYKTFWITNQQTMTKRNTMLTTFSEQADEQVYLNNNRNQNAAQYDGDVIAPFNKALADAAPRKLIVVHLLGTHMSYQYRYPPTFNKFTDRKGVPDGVRDDQVPTYNSYDNAVLYNDFVVSSLIKDYAKSDPNGFLMYLSDHGEDVFDSVGHSTLGRNEAKPTAPMYTIPFMAWASPKWRETHDWSFAGDLARPYSSSQLIHTWADLAGLSFDELDRSKSLVSDSFTPRPLMIGNPYERQSRPLIDFSLMKPKSTPTDPAVAQK